MLAAGRRTEDGALLWLQNVTDQAREAMIALPQRAIKTASLCNTLGETGQSLEVNNGEIKITVPARGIVGILVE